MGRCIPHDPESKSFLKLGACVLSSQISVLVLFCFFFLTIAQSDLGEITVLDEE